MASGSVSEIASLANTSLFECSVQADGGRHIDSKVRQFSQDDFTSEREVVGSGGFGIVFRRRLKNINQIHIFIAQKQMHCGRIESEAKSGLLKEAELLSELNHGNIIQLLGILYEDDKVSLIMEFAFYGCCRDFFKGLRIVEALKLPLKFKILYQTCSAMAYLHRKKILHLDLKSTNILINQNLNVKLCDFGLSQLKTLSDLIRLSRSVIEAKGDARIGGTLTHIAPERLRDINNKPDTKSDVYSFGIFLWELLTETEPFEYAQSRSSLTHVIIEGQRPDLTKLPTLVPSLLRDLMVRSWNGKAEERPEFTEIFNIFDEEPCFTREEIKQSESEIQSMITSSSRPIHSESNVIKPPYHAHPQQVVTQSEGRTRAMLSPPTLQNNETRVKQLYASSSPSGPSNFITPNVTVLRREPTGSESSHYPQSSLKTNDLQFSKPLDSGNFRSEDDEPLLPVDQPVERKPSRRLCFAISFVILLLIVGGSAALVCWKEGFFVVKNCSSLIKPAHGNVDCTNGNYEKSVCTYQCPSDYCLRMPGSSSCVYTSKDDASETTCLPGHSPSWSQKTTPYCEKEIPCSSLNTVAGKYTCTNPKVQDLSDPVNGTTCRLDCESGFGHKGQAYFFCNETGNWNKSGNNPTCIRECPKPSVDPHASYNCTDSFFAKSVCEFACRKNYVMLGPIRTSCIDGSWKDKPPFCVCPSCMGGENCDVPVTWNNAVQEMRKNLIKNTPFKYDTHQVKCYEVPPPHHEKSQNISCVCRDIPSNRMKQCNGISNLEQVCETTLATFLQLMAYENIYRLPCDANNMTAPC